MSIWFINGLEPRFRTVDGLPVHFAESRADPRRIVAEALSGIEHLSQPAVPTGR